MSEESCLPPFSEGARLFGPTLMATAEALMTIAASATLIRRCQVGYALPGTAKDLATCDERAG